MPKTEYLIKNSLSACLRMRHLSISDWSWCNSHQSGHFSPDGVGNSSRLSIKAVWTRVTTLIQQRNLKRESTSFGSLFNHFKMNSWNCIDWQRQHHFSAKPGWKGLVLIQWASTVQPGRTCDFDSNCQINVIFSGALGSDEINSPKGFGVNPTDSLRVCAVYVPIWALPLGIYSNWQMSFVQPLYTLLKGGKFQGPGSFSRGLLIDLMLQAFEVSIDKYIFIPWISVISDTSIMIV